MKTQSPSETLSPRQKLLALLTLVVAVVLEIVDLTIVNTALPAIKSDLGAGAEAAQWVVAGYALSFALLLMAGGRLGDSFGYRRIFLIGVAGFTLASLACGLAASPGQLVAARLLQGAMGAIMAPQAMALMQVLFDPLERVSKLALFGLIGGLAAIGGPVLGGLLIEANLLGLGWRLVFLINLPLGLLALAAGWYFLPVTRSGRPAGFDLPGMALFAAAVLALLWPLTRADAGWTAREWLCLALALPLAAWGWRHVGVQVKAGRAALFDPELLTVPAFAPGLALSVAFAAANAGFLLAFAFALQSERGESPLVTGLLHMPFGFGAMVGIGLLGRTFLPKYGRWVLVAGASTMALAAAAVLAGIGQLALSWPQLTPLLVLAGVGMGTISGCINPVALARIDRDHAGAASALLRTCQQLGSALGVALAGSVYFAWRSDAGPPPSLAAAMVVAALLLLCAWLAARLPARIFAAQSAPE
jgi:EmrB/QacA subfamily drug resistance transporter